MDEETTETCDQSMRQHSRRGMSRAMTVVPPREASDAPPSWDYGNLPVETPSSTVTEKPIPYAYNP